LRHEKTIEIIIGFTPEKISSANSGETWSLIYSRRRSRDKGLAAKDNSDQPWRHKREDMFPLEITNTKKIITFGTLQDFEVFSPKSVTYLEKSQTNPVATVSFRLCTAACLIIVLAIPTTFQSHQSNNESVKIPIR